MVSRKQAASPGKRDVGDYALLWANGKSFREIYELMKADAEQELRREIALERLAADELTRLDQDNGSYGTASPGEAR